MDNDHATACRTVLDHLTDAGYRRPALMVSSGRQSYLRDIRRAYLSWCRQRRLEPVVASVVGAAADEPAARATEDLLRGHPEVDSVFAMLDRLAIGCLQAADALRRRTGP